MVKPVAKAEISSFVKGFITEASPLNFPADASRDEENYDLNRDGSRDRRLGIDLEDDYQIRDTGYTLANLVAVSSTSYKWFNAGNNASNEFIVVQFGNRIDVYTAAVSNISRDGFIGSVTFSQARSDIRFSYASVDGFLIVATGLDNVFVVEYDGTNLIQSSGRILVRDSWGLPSDENNALNKRPTAITSAIAYNLQNQGWGIPRKNSAGTLSDPINLFFNDLHAYPSNAEVVYTGLQFQPVTSGATFERIYTNLYDDMLGLDAQAAKGYYIIDALRRGTSRVLVFNENKNKFPALSQTLSSLPQDTTTGGCSAIADFAGRVFFGGFEGEVIDGDVNSPILSSFIFFSQVVKSRNDIFKCYQNGDPTSRDSNDLVDTDGGFIRISGAKRIIGLVALSNQLFVIADNGIWMVVGGSDYGFTATNYSVRKISSFGCFNRESIVVVSDQIYFWGEEGIFLVNRNQYGDWVVNSISESTIQTYYNSIETFDKENAKGIYDAFDKKVRWLFNQDTDRNNNNIVREITLDLILGSFNKIRIYNLTTNPPEVIGFIQTASFIAGEAPHEIIAGVDLVVVGGEQVAVTESTRTSGLQSIKYITLIGNVGGNIGYTFSQYKNIDFMDWKSVNGVGVDAKAYILTGLVTAGDSAITKQSPYLVVHMRRTEDGVEDSGGSLVPSKQSSCLIRSQWDWANSANSGKWSPLFQAYRYRRPYFITGVNDPYDNGFETVVTKNKLRGRGRALSLYFETEPGKDCRILGWNLSLTGNNLA